MQKISSDDGKTASFSVRLNANRGTTEVVGYPSDQCLIYAALPRSLTSRYEVTPPSDSSGLDYEFAYDIWLTSASAASSNNWNNDLELMIWTYVDGQRPAGSKVATLSDGSAVWFAGTKGANNSTVSVVLPSNTTSGTVDIASVVSQLKTAATSRRPTTASSTSSTASRPRTAAATRSPSTRSPSPAERYWPVSASETGQAAERQLSRTRADRNC